MRRFDWFVVAALALMAVGNVAIILSFGRQLTSLEHRIELRETARSKATINVIESQGKVDSIVRRLDAMR